MKVAILSINIGKYICFWKEFYQSAQHYFLPDVDRHFFVFTDDIENIDLHHDDVTAVYQQDLGWPGNTLYRFRMFLSIEDQLQDFDYIFFGNSNLLFIEKLGQEILPTSDQKWVFVKREKSLMHNNIEVYETRPESLAYVAPEDRMIYVRGGFNGGIAEDYLDMCHELSHNIDVDNNHGIVAVWHDESHITRFAINHPEAKILPAGYLYPEEYVMPYTRHILIRKKNNESIRNLGKLPVKQVLINKLKMTARNAMYWVLIKIKVIKWIED